ncbi:hypothetical protein IAD21_03180 [Abditibacteriota bacterium]|nr:hypothetical protein IAD21_03180 [Abditibacteriota bacterium]
MTSPQLSQQQREQADKIFKRAWLQGLIGVWAFGLVFHLLIASFAHFIFQQEVKPSWISGLIVMYLFMGHNYATQQVRKAGLSLDRTETRFIPKTAGQFEGGPIIYKSRFTIKAGRICLIFWTLLLGVLGGLYSQGQMNMSPVAAPIWLCFMGFLWLSSAYYASGPVLFRLDSNGIYSFFGFWPRRIKWSSIAGLEVKSAFSYTAVPTGQILTFRDAKNNTLLVVPLKEKTTDGAEDESLVAQVEAKLSGESKISGE